MPPDFAFPNRDGPVLDADAILRGRLRRTGRTTACTPSAASSAASRSRRRARRCAASPRALERAYPKENARNGATVDSAERPALDAQSRLLVTALFGAALGVLLIACTNLANLLLARAHRAPEGARRPRGARRRAGPAAAPAPDGEPAARRRRRRPRRRARRGGRAAARAAAPGLPPDHRRALSVDPRVLAFAAALTTVTGVAFGVLPALRACGDARRRLPARGGARGRGPPGGAAPLDARRRRGRGVGRAARGGGPADCARSGSSRTSTPASAPKAS